MAADTKLAGLLCLLCLEQGRVALSYACADQDSNSAPCIWYFLDLECSYKMLQLMLANSMSSCMVS